MGNMDSPRSLQLFHSIGNMLNASTLSSNRDLEKYHVLDIRNKSYVYRNITNNDENDKSDSILNYYQIGNREIIKYSHLILLKEIIKKKIYDFLENSENSGSY